MTQGDIRITPGQEHGLACLGVEHDDLAARGEEARTHVTVAGDLCWTPRPGVPEPAELDECPWAPFAALLSAQELSIANLEAALTPLDQPIAKSGPRVRSAPSLAGVVRRGGFGAVSLANNHVGDFGERGVVDTLEACRAAGLLTVGAGADVQAAEAPLVVERGGVRLAFVAATEGNLGAAGSGRAGTAALRNGRAQTAVARLSAAGAATVVLLHAGNEYYPLPSPYLVDLAHSFVEAGASAVVIHHQHMPGGVQVHRGVPVVYGTGNFLFPMYYPYVHPGWHQGYLVRLGFSGTRVSELTLFPYHQSRGQRRVEAMPPDEAEELAARLRERSAALADASTLEREWERFCGEQRPRLLAALLGMTRLERRLVRLLGIWPRWRMRPDRVAALLTLLATESYSQAAMTTLKEELRRTGVSSRGV
ncbi:MAG: CapA family protein [Thermoleophilia bacterium]